MARVDLFGSQQNALSVAINNQVSLNCYIVPSPRGRNRVAMVASMGSKLFSETSGQIRGCHKLKDKAYFVIDNLLYLVDSFGAFQSLGTVPGMDYVSITDDSNSLIIVNGTNKAYYYDTSTSTFSSIDLPNVAYTITNLDTYIAFSSVGQRWYISSVGDSDSFDDLDFASAIKSPDDIVAIWEDHSELVLFGETTIEPWFNSANIDFPFSQNTAGIVERGLYARRSVAKDDNTLFFLGDDLIVYRLEGYQPIRVSTESEETYFSDFKNQGNDDLLKKAYAYTYTEHGHKFYQLTVPGLVTLVYNIATKQWHQAKHWDYETHNSECYLECYGKHLTGGLDGKIYEISRNYYDDNGRPLKRLRRSNFYHLEDKMVRWKKIKFIFDFGTTKVLTGQGDDPKVVVRWSYDSGRTWRSEKFLPLGRAGDYLAKAIRRSCGSSRNRLFEFYVTDPVPFFLIDAFAEIS
jgi:hypothetical protein